MFAAFNSTWDWTAVGTLTLAVVTGVSLAFGWGSLRQAQQQIDLSQRQLEQTQHEIEVSRQEVAEAHRPVVVGLADRRKMSLSGADVPPEIPCKPYVHRDGFLTVPIENIGTGPALLMDASVSLRNDEGGPTGIGGTGKTTLAGLRADGRLPLVFPVHGLRSGTEPDFQLEMIYEDVAKRRWRTVDVFVPIKGDYRGPTIE